MTNGKGQAVAKAAEPQKTAMQLRDEDQRKAVVTVRAELERMRDQLAAALPAHLTVDRMLRMVMTAIQKTPSLLECDRKSLYGAIYTAGAMGLEPDGIHGHLVPFKGKVQFIPDYKGFIKIASNNDVVIEAHEVCQRDMFEYEYGLEPRLVHRPDRSANRGAVIAYYATARDLQSGHAIFNVMTLDEVNAVRDKYSQSFKSQPAQSPWTTNPIPMGKKTTVRGMASYLPRSAPLQLAVQVSDRIESGEPATIENGVVTDLIEKADGDRPEPKKDGGEPEQRVEVQTWPFYDATGKLTDTIVEGRHWVARMQAAIADEKDPALRWAIVEHNHEGMARLREEEQGDLADEIAASAPQPPKAEQKPAAETKADPKPAEQPKEEPFDMAKVPEADKNDFTDIVRRMSKADTQKGLRSTWTFEGPRMKTLSAYARRGLELALDENKKRLAGKA